MRLSGLIGGFIGLVLLVSLGSCALLLWHSEQSRLWGRRIWIAHESYEAHQALESNIYQLLKQYGDALLIGDRDAGALETELAGRIANNIATIRRLIAEEVVLEGRGEAEELTLLAEIERKVAQITDTLNLFTADGQPLEDQARRERLVQILDREIDVDLSALITSALLGEQEEVTGRLAAAEAFRERIRFVAIAAVIVALTATALAGWYYQRAVARPLGRLMEGAAAYGSGRFDGAVAVDGAQEFRQLGHVLSAMASNLSKREQSQRQQTVDLERAVRARTAELEHLLTRLEGAEANRRQLMADISHELRTPLTIIKGEADVVLRGTAKPTEEYQEALTRIREAARHTNRIVDDLLLVARQEAGQLRLDVREVDLHKVLSDAAALMPNPISIRPDLPPLKIQADPVRLGQCMVALFHNALRYGGPNVSAWYESLEGAVLIVVEDDGPGLSDTEKAQAFERFFRGSNAMRAGMEGTGLGLPIVRAIVEAHGGSATLGDRPGGGLRAEVRLPNVPRIGLVWDSAAQPHDALRVGGQRAQT